MISNHSLLKVAFHFSKILQNLKSILNLVDQFSADSNRSNIRLLHRLYHNLTNRVCATSSLTICRFLERK